MKEHSAFNALGSYAPPPNIVPPPPPVRCNALLDGFVPAFFPDCGWCVLSPWISTLDGKPYRLHCANDCTEEEARHIAYQLERYAHPKEEAMDYANTHTPNAKVEFQEGSAAE